MAVTIEEVRREFLYKGMKLPDINPQWPVERVIQVHAAANYSELTSGATLEFRGVKDGVAIYEVLHEVRDKG